jgi:general stress protein 26
MGTTKNLIHEKGIEKIKELAEAANICHFVTALDQHPLASRPMSVLQVDDDGSLWFFSARSSDKNLHIHQDNEVQLFFSNGSSSEYLSVYGHASITTNQTKIEALWTPLAKTWFHGGPTDPEITLIQVEPVDAYYWDTKNNKMIQLIKMLAGAVVGKTLDDGVEGKIRI